jgi:hypothetical protein
MRKRKKSLNKSVSFGSILFLEVLVVTLLCSFCFFQIITISSAKYSASDFEEKIANLSHQTKLLEIKLSENGFLGKAEKLVDVSKFEEINEVRYLKVSENIIVSK